MHGTYERVGAGFARLWVWKVLLGTALTPLLLVGGCETNAGTGMLAGGAIGALAGGAIGAVTHHPEAGALIGAAAARRAAASSGRRWTTTRRRWRFGTRPSVVRLGFRVR